MSIPQTSEPKVEFVTGTVVRGGQAIVVRATFQRYDAPNARYVYDTTSDISAMLVSDPSHKKPAYRTLVAEVTKCRNSQYTLVIPGDVLLPDMLPLLFDDAEPWLVITQGAHGRTLYPMQWGGR